MGYIYYIQNLVNKKGYVGQTSQSLETRWQQHKNRASIGQDSALGAAIRKYGERSFTIEEICSADDILLDDLEIHYIAKFGTFANTGHGYNLTVGGGGTRGWAVSEETKAKISASNKGKKKPPRTVEHSAHIAEAHRGKKMPPRTAEHRANMSAANKNNPNIYHRPVNSAETRAKISAAKKRRSIKGNSQGDLNDL